MQLIKSLLILTFHALLVAAFILAIATISDGATHAAEKMKVETSHIEFLAIRYALELPFFLGILVLVSTESIEQLKNLKSILFFRRGDNLEATQTHLSTPNLAPDFQSTETRKAVQA